MYKDLQTFFGDGCMETGSSMPSTMAWWPNCTICLVPVECICATFGANNTASTAVLDDFLLILYARQACRTPYMSLQGFHVVLSDMCHSTMGSSSADVLRSLDLASCAAELAVGSLEPTQLHQLPKVHNPRPEPSSNPTHNAQDQHNQHPESLQDTVILDGSQGVLLPKGHLVMKLLQV